MTFSRIIDAKEPWWKGSPEVEVHVHGPQDPAYPQRGENLSCSGEHVAAERYFDQNDAFWSGSVLIWTKAQDDQFQAEHPDGYHIIFWEDDETPCTLVTDVNTTMATISSLASVAGGLAMKVATGWGWPGAVWVVGNWLANSFHDADWLNGNDDIIGVLLPTQNYYSDGSQYELRLDNGTLNGRARIVEKP